MSRDDRFTSGGGAYSTQCAYCRHLAAGPTWACKAFPSSIPAEIVANRHDHRKPYLEDGEPADVGTHGDQSITFAPRDDVPPASLAALYRELDRQPPNVH